MDKDSYFIPAGYDSISLLKSTDVNQDLTIPFEERIPVIKPKNIIREEEVICEDINTFLGKIAERLRRKPNDYGSNPRVTTEEKEKEPEVRPTVRTSDFKEEKKGPDFSQFMSNPRPPSVDRKPLTKGDSMSKLPTKLPTTTNVTTANVTPFSLKNDDLAKEAIKKQLRDNLLGNKKEVTGIAGTTGTTGTTNPTDKATDNKRKLELLKKPK
jgi:hypothetical protein